MNNPITIKASKALEQTIVALEAAKYAIADIVRESVVKNEVPQEGAFTQALEDIEFNILTEMRRLHGYLWESNQ